MQEAWIKNEMIAPGTITDSRFAYKTIQDGSIADDAIKTNAIANYAVTSGKIADFSIGCDKLKSGSNYIMHYITMYWDNSSSSSTDAGALNFSLVSTKIDYPTIESIAKDIYHNDVDEQIRFPCSGYIKYKNPSKDKSGACSSVQSTGLNLLVKLYDTNPASFQQIDYIIDRAQEITIIDQAVEIVAH